VRTLRSLPNIVILCVLGALTLYPTVFVIITSFKSNSQFYSDFWFPMTPLHLHNYALAWNQIAPFMLNSLIVTSLATTGVIVVSCLAGYAFARMDFPGRQLLYYLVIFLLMVPAVLTLVPTFLLIRTLHLLNTYWALVLPYIAGDQVLAIFILRTFFAGLPEDLFEAARIDGAGELRIFLRIAVPLVRSSLITIGILEILSTWNDYLWPFLVLQKPSVQTLVVGLVNFQSRFYTNWGPLMAGYVLASLPLMLLFFLGMRAFISGLTEGALRI
jgi:ABC-type glycerol-3-phosphate transport system permease component